ncbi:MAG: helix-hairpin-helix domain-containing protein [Fimbriimonadaceae bacterium]|nr:helix-hairpin-helix domain-containing protein [Fimbriimonadaceae bacterium]
MSFFDSLSGLQKASVVGIASLALVGVGAVGQQHLATKGAPVRTKGTTQASGVAPLLGTNPAPRPSQAQVVAINSASAAELETLPRIGPALAQRILDYRSTHGPFRSVEELVEVKGIGPKTMDKLRPRVKL